MKTSQKQNYAFKSEIIELFGADGQSTVFKVAADSPTGYRKLTPIAGGFRWLPATAGEVKTVERALEGLMTEREHMEQASNEYWARLGAVPDPGGAVAGSGMAPADPATQSAWGRALGR